MELRNEIKNQKKKMKSKNGVILDIWERMPEREMSIPFMI